MQQNTGGQLKNSVALAIGAEAFISQHIGDLETPQAFTAFQKVIADLESFYVARPDLVAADAHPDYLATQHAHRLGCPVLPVQHHYAHVLACLAEHGLEPDALGIGWDGTGYGLDGTIWGGECFTIADSGFERCAHLRTFLLPGGERAVREPRRSALGLLYELFGPAAFEMGDCPVIRSFSGTELSVLRRMLAQGVQAPRTSSAGRLFDGVAALVGLRTGAGFEGQAAMELEFALEGFKSDEAYPLGATMVSSEGACAAYYRYRALPTAARARTPAEA